MSEAPGWTGAIHRESLEDSPDSWTSGRDGMFYGVGETARGHVVVRWFQPDRTHRWGIAVFGSIEHAAAEGVPDCIVTAYKAALGNPSVVA